MNQPGSFVAARDHGHSGRDADSDEGSRAAAVRAHLELLTCVVRDAHGKTLLRSHDAGLGLVIVEAIANAAGAMPTLRSPSPGWPDGFQAEVKGLRQGAGQARPRAA